MDKINSTKLRKRNGRYQGYIQKSKVKDKLTALWQKSKTDEKTNKCTQHNTETLRLTITDHIKKNGAERRS